MTFKQHSESALKACLECWAVILDVRRTNTAGLRKLSIPTNYLAGMHVRDSFHPRRRFVKDSESAKAHLLEAMRATMEHKKAMKGVKSGESSPRVTRGSGGSSTGGMAPQPQEMAKREMSNPHL